MVVPRVRLLRVMWLRRDPTTQEKHDSRNRWFEIGHLRKVFRPAVSTTGRQRKTRYLEEGKYINSSDRRAILQQIWVVVKIMVPFWAP